MFLGRFFLLRLAQCGLCIFLLVLRNCGCVVIRALLCLNPQLFAPAPHFLFRHQSHIFRGGDFCPPPPHVSAVSSSIEVRMPRAVRVKA